MGGWSKKGEAVANCDGFVILLRIRRRAGAVLDRLLWTVEKKCEPNETDANLARFVDGAGDLIEDDLMALAASSEP